MATVEQNAQRLIELIQKLQPENTLSPDQSTIESTDSTGQTIELMRNNRAQKTSSRRIR
jgi:hypothetical protein